MQRLTPCLLVGMLALVGPASGCWHRPDAPVSRDLLAGDYVYHSDDPGSPHDPDRLTLRADGTYVLEHMPRGRPGKSEEGAWQLVSAPDPYVLVGHAGYPIEVRGKRLRLTIDYDLGHSYEKAQQAPKGTWSGGVDKH